MRPLLLTIAVTVAACSTTPTVKTDFDPSADFPNSGSYSWIYTQPPAGMNPLLYERVRSSIDRALTTRGYNQSASGDFAVAFTLGSRDDVRVTDFGPYANFYPRWGYGARYGWVPTYSHTEVTRFTEGTLAIDFYDTSSKRPIWHGVASQEITPYSVTQEEIDNAVDAVISKFPPKL